MSIKITLNYISLFAFFLFVLIAHGLFIGLINGNKPFIIFNDTVPILMMALNILRMQSLEEIKNPINFDFLLKGCVLLAATNVAITFIADPTRVSLGNTSLFYASMLAAFLLLRPFPKWLLPIIIITFLMTIGVFNRSAMLFIAIVLTTYLGYTLLHRPVYTVSVGVIMMIAAFVIWNTLPKDSGTYKRITNISKIDLSARKGSIGERQQEQDQVNVALKKKGPTSQWVGLGFGGLYEMQSTHEYIRDYGHAHYSWVWFNLRYGKIGYFYLIIFSGTIVLSLIRNIQLKTPTSFFVSFLCLLSMIYLFTYVNSIWLLSGLSFLYLHPALEGKLQTKKSKEIKPS